MPCAALEEKLAEIAEDLEDEARADEIARVRLWAAKSQLDDIRDMIYEIQRRRVPFKDPEIRILKAVVYCVGEQHSDLVDPYARRSNEVAWKYMRRVRPAAVPLCRRLWLPRPARADRWRRCLAVPCLAPGL